jgi:hypothetical protein
MQTDHITAFVHHVVRTVHTIKFSYEWLEKACTANGRQWKQEYLERLFQSVEPEAIKQIELSGTESQRYKKLKKHRQRFKARHEKVVASRNHIRRLYTIVCDFRCFSLIVHNNLQFGAGVLLDPLWGTNSQLKATPRSRTFGQTLTHFLEHVTQDLSPHADDSPESSESDSEDNLLVCRMRFQRLLLHLITLLAGEKLSTWVGDFLEHGHTHLRHDFVCRCTTYKIHH